MKRLYAALGLAALAGCATGVTLRMPVVDDGAKRALQRAQWSEYFAKEDRATEVMWKLRTANTSFCSNVEPAGGWSEINQSYYEAFKKDRVFLHEPADPMNQSERIVQHVVPGGPAWNAGLRAGHRYMVQHEGNRNVVLRVGRQGPFGDMVGPFDKVDACLAPVFVVKTAKANALTDGNFIGVTSGMMDFVANDHELAFVLAHELAHMSLDHVGKRKWNWVRGMLAGGAIDALAGTRGADVLLGAVGAAAYSQDFEREADYMGAYMMVRAGFEPDSVAPLWARAVGETPAVWSTTHPVDAERELNAALYAAEIRNKRLAGLPLVPERR